MTRALRTALLLAAALPLLAACNIGVIPRDLPPPAAEPEQQAPATATAPALVNLSSRTTSSTGRLSTPPFSFHWATATLAPASQAAPASAPMPLIGRLSPMRIGPLCARSGRTPVAPRTAAAADP